MNFLTHNCQSSELRVTYIRHSCKTVSLQVAHHIRDDDTTNHITNLKMSLQYPGPLLANTLVKVSN